MDQFVLDPAPLHNNKSLSTRTNKKQELPKYQVEQNATYQKDLLEKEISKKLSAKADVLANEIFSCPRFKLSNSQTLILDGVGTGVLLSDFANNSVVKTQTYQTVGLLYLMLLV